MKKISLLVIGLGSLVLAACALPQQGNHPVDTLSGTVVTHTGADTDIGNEAMPEDTDSLEVESPTVKLSIRRQTGAILMGTGSLPTLTIVSDLNCFYCREFAVKDMAWIEDEYATHGTLAMKHIFLPMDTVGKYMAQIAVCGVEQNKFREVLHELSASPVSGDTQMQALVKKLGLNLVNMRRCIASPATKTLLDNMKKEADALGVTRVPMFFTAKTSWLGVETREVLKKNLDAAIR